MVLVANMSVFAVVPTTDSFQERTDTTAITTYKFQIGSYLQRIANNMNADVQAQSLAALANMSTMSGALCTLCTPSDLAQLNQYLNQVDSDLITQFSNQISTLTGTKQSITSLQDVASTLTDNHKVAALALQQAAIATLSLMQNTLAQMVLIQAQAEQRVIVKEKLQQVNTVNSLGSGFHSGL